EHLLPAESQELSGEIGRAVCRLLYEFDVRADRIVGAEATQQQLAASDHDGEEVVEVVRDATGEASDGFHLPGLCKLLLGLREFLVGALSLLIEPAVLERDSGLGGERHGEREILQGEPLLSPGSDAEHPEDVW